MKHFSIILLAFALATPVWSQYNIVEVGVAHGRFSAAELGMNTPLTGLHLALEFPLATYSTRFGLDFGSRIGSDTTGKSLTRLTSLKLMGGKVFGSGKRLQVPLLAGGFMMTPSGGLELADDKKSLYGVSLAGGLRLYVSNRFSIFTEALYDIGLLSDYSYVNEKGTRVNSNVPVNHLSFSLGVAFVYRKSNKDAKK